LRLSVVFALAVSSCAPRLAGQGVEARMPAIEGNHYITRDGLPLGLQHWDAREPKAVIVALHGMSDYSNAFAMPASWWAKRGISTYAYDQRGFGRSPNTGLWAGSEVMRRDFTDFVDVVRARFPGLPVFALGESMGGAVVMSDMAGTTPPRVEGVILSAPAVWGWRTLPLSHRVALWLAAHSTPWWKLSGEGLHLVPSDNIPMLRALARDPLYQHRARADAVYGLVTLMDEGYDAAGHMDTAPILFLYGDKDQIIPSGPTKEVAAKLGPDATVKHYPNGYHMLLRGLEAEKVWRDVANWIDANVISVD
jgi:alpha-beta hydrolase superfamily lysophospholipase